MSSNNVVIRNPCIVSLNIGSILASIIGACAPLPLAKAIDVWGRVEGFAFMMTVCIVGMIMKATCTTVQMYIGAHILYWVGHIGVMYVIGVMQGRPCLMPHSNGGATNSFVCWVGLFHSTLVELSVCFWTLT